MTGEPDFSVQYNEYGEVDAAHYIALAKQERAEWVAKSLRGLVKVVFNVLSYSRSEQKTVWAYSN